MRRLRQSGLLTRKTNFIHTFQQRNSQTFAPKRIDTVPLFLHRHLFGVTPAPQTAVHDEKLERIRLPKLRGSNLQEHFMDVAKDQIAPYRSLLDSALLWREKEMPKRPEEWKFAVGWTRYGKDGTATEQVPHPTERVFVFDVETCVRDGELPTLATALSNESWYSWCSERLVMEVPVSTEAYRSDLIQLGGSLDGSHQARIAIGHNVAYDRVRAAEPYDIKESKLRFWDTMAMSIPMFGMADHQLIVYESSDKYGQEIGEGWRDVWKDRVCRNSLAALHDFFYKERGDTRMDKSMQKMFVDESIEVIRKEFQTLTSYCADDVYATLEVFQKLLPAFYQHFPHPATMAGMMEMSNAYLPINQNWPLFYAKAESAITEKSERACRGVLRAAWNRCREFEATGSKDGSVDDVFMWSEDWIRDTKKNDAPEWFKQLFKTKKLAATCFAALSENTEMPELRNEFTVKSKVIPKLFGLCYGAYPLFHKRDFGWGYLVPEKSKKEPENLDKKLSLRNGRMARFPSRKIRELVTRLEMDSGELLHDEKRKLPGLTGDCVFYKLPHKNGGNNVGFPLGKDFLDDLETKVMRCTRNEEDFLTYLDSIKTTTFWTSFRARYKRELPVWYVQESADADEVRRGALAPAICPAGTVSRRSVHRLWVTATNANEEDRIGSGLKSMVQVHPGHLFVGADVDSQEQWLAALFGDASASMSRPEWERSPGCTPFSNMMLAGNKNDHSDLHSVVAKDLAIHRNSAKVLNYARLYGAGERNAAELLAKQGVNMETARQKAATLFKITKGERKLHRRLHQKANIMFKKFVAEQEAAENTVDYLVLDGRYYLPEYSERECKSTLRFEKWVMDGLAQLTEKSKLPGRIVLKESCVIPLLYDDRDMCDKVMLYCGGYESDCFNFLEIAASSKELRTPILSAKLGTSLSPLPIETPDREFFAAKYKRSLINWIVQSSAVDFLHLLLVCLRWLCDEYAIDARFSISIHDEVRYVVAAEEENRFALALHLSNMYVRAAITDKLGLKQLPMSVAFFSQVDVDTVLRKEVNARCINPDGSAVPDGRTCTIYDVIERTNGSLER